MKYKIGDIVKVVNKLKCYSTYEDWINRYGYQYKKNWKNGCHIYDTETEHKILGKGKHSCGNILYLIQNINTKQVFIIAEEGIRLTEKNIIEYKGKKYDVLSELLFNEIPAEEINLHLREHKEEILDEAEKRYLRNVIKPFKNENTYIEKINSCYGEKYYIYISLGNEYINLPYFTDKKMYKGMEPDKEYTLEELGL